MNINTNLFKLPIEYIDNSELDDKTIDELELTKSIDKSIYEELTNERNNNILTRFTSKYTDNISYLKDTQTLIKQSFKMHNSINIDDITDLCNEIKNNTGFHEKYFYVSWDFAKELNNNSFFLQWMSIYNIASPILSLCLPIICLIIPIIAIKIQNQHLSMENYLSILKTLLSNHSIFKMFTTFDSVSNQQKAYLAISSAFYLFSIYQNMLVCIRFYSNIHKINNYLQKIRTYLDSTLSLMKEHLDKSNTLNTYTEFNKSIHNCIRQITDYSQTIKPLHISTIGDIMKTFYQLKENKDIIDMFEYTFDFHKYMKIITAFSTHVNNNKMHKTTFYNKSSKINSKNKCKFKQMYYPKYIYTNKVKNDVNISKNIIITGPNASGKTTLLKTTFINILLSQQIGYGCYNSLKLTPFHTLCSYINIPDTSGRDSLFQAEARRCKDILTSIKETGKSHFCIFDELYSGTNPNEAVVSSIAFINYINKQYNTSFILTTHYTDICTYNANAKNDKNDNDKNDANVINCYMSADIVNGKYVYSYKLKEGISNIKGGLKVLEDMDYPIEILNDTKTQLS